MNAVSGSLVLVDCNTKIPVVFWRGRKIDVASVRVSKGIVSMTLSAALDSVLVQEMRDQGVGVITKGERHE